MCEENTDGFDLDRFIAAQAGVYAGALAELKRGHKRSHWMWFVFPQIEGLGYSSTSRKYAIKNLEEAGAYLAHPILGPRLLECCNALLSVRGRSAAEIMGSPDDLKLRSSMTLFSLTENPPPEFQHVLDRYFGGEHDPRTLELLDL